MRPSRRGACGSSSESSTKAPSRRGDDDARRSDPQLKRAGAAFHGERALGDDDLRVLDGGDADGDGLAHLGFEGGDGGVFLAVALGGGAGRRRRRRGRDEILILVVEGGEGAVTVRGAVRVSLTRRVRLEAIWERGGRRGSDRRRCGG